MSRSLAPFIGAALLLGVILVSLGAGAATPPPEAFSLGMGELQFQTDAFTFATSSLTLPASFEGSETATTLEVVLPADVLFDFDNADIRAAAEATMHDLAQLIRDKAHGPVIIQGFTDALGNDAYNQRLSERRAASVKMWLVTREGFRSTLFATAGFGARNPVAPNRRPDGSDDPDGRQRNRRVTLTIRK